MQRLHLNNLKKFFIDLSGTFGVRVFAYLLVSMIIIHLTFDFVLVRTQQDIISLQFEKEGKTITNLLAVNIRMGVFSENFHILAPIVKSVLDLSEVTGITIITPNGDILLENRQKPSESVLNYCESDLVKFQNTATKHKPNSEWIVSNENNECMIVGSPVLIPTDLSNELIYLSDGPTKPSSNILIGYVAVAFDKKGIIKSRKRIISEHASLFVVFLLLLSLVTFLIVRMVLKPINALVDTVKKSPLEVKSTSQISMLSKSFSALTNQLSESFETINKLHSDLENLTRELLKTQEKERQKIALDLHDDVAQDLSSLRMTCDTILDDIPSPPQTLLTKQEKMSALLKNCIATVRGLSHSLQPPDLKDLGLVRSLMNLCNDFSRENNIEVDFVASGFNNFRPDYQISINCYRIVQEALNNVKKHAKAKNVEVKILASFPSLIIRINDDGVGFDIAQKTAEAIKNKRMGLQNMEKRAQLLKGNMKIKSSAENGTKILFEIPGQENHYV